MSKYNLIFFSLMGIILSCTQPPDYPIEPVIDFVGLSSSRISQGSPTGDTDTLQIILSFTDGDGDLGTNNGEFDITLIDSRDGAEIPYRLLEIPPEGVGNGISGEIYINVYNQPFNMCCIYSNGQDPCTASTSQPTDEFYFTVFIKDAAGNESNRVNTSPITLLCL